MLADLRRIDSYQKIEKADFTTYSLPASEETLKTPEREKALHVSTIGYDYLQKDLRKTIILTCSIVIAELLIRYYFRI